MIFAYVYDFVSFLFEEDLNSEIKSVILYGSVASGKYDDESDVDLFIEVWDGNRTKAVESEIKSRLNRFEEIAARTWRPRGIANNFSIIVGNLDSEEWKNLKQDVISNGILLYGKFERLPDDIRHKALFTFPLADLKQAEKMRLIRELYGYELEKSNKTYRKEGLVEKCGGDKLSENPIIVPVEKVKEFRKLFSTFGVTPNVREVWVRKG